LSGVATDELVDDFGAPVTPRGVEFTVSFMEAWAIGGDESCLTWLLSQATFSALEFVLAAGAAAFAARGGDVLRLLLARPLPEASVEAPPAAAVSTATAATAPTATAAAVSTATATAASPATAAAAAGGAPAGAGVAASPSPAGISTRAVAGDDSNAIRIEQPVSAHSIAPASLRAHVWLASAAALSLWCSFGGWDTDRLRVYDDLSDMQRSAAGMGRREDHETEMAASIVATLPSLRAWLASSGWIDEPQWEKLMTQSLPIATFCSYPAVVAALVRHGAAIVDDAEGGTGNSALVAGLPDWNCSWYEPKYCRCLVANLRTLVRLGADPYAGQRVRTGITGSLQRYHRTTLVGRDIMPVPLADAPEMAVARWPPVGLSRIPEPASCLWAVVHCMRVYDYKLDVVDGHRLVAAVACMLVRERAAFAAMDSSSRLAGDPPLEASNEGNAWSALPTITPEMNAWAQQAASDLRRGH
jgi:hypothetical protein